MSAILSQPQYVNLFKIKTTSEQSFNKYVMYFIQKNNLDVHFWKGSETFLGFRWLIMKHYVHVI